MSYDILSDDQQAAVDAIRELDGPFFLTGEAGSGKTFVVDYLRDTEPGCCVTAMTGSAAQLVQGVTLHSFAGIHPTYGLFRSNKVEERILNCEILIIDEISMASVEVLQLLHERFEQLDHHPKLVMVGDFLQLPPVDGERIFDLEDWNMCHILKLTTQHRQNNADFIRVLNMIRRGQLTEEVKAFVESRRTNILPDDCTHLMARKKSVDARNNYKLDQLPGRVCRSEMEVIPHTIVDRDGNILDPKPLTNQDYNRLRLPRILKIKENARVVLLNNDKDGRWFNGSTGFVRSVRRGEVFVDLDVGGSVRVTKINEMLRDKNGEITYTIEQYPIKLAWALTIHKSQGMSLDRVGVDLEGHFERGQTYVAMSRCRTPEGLFLRGKLLRLMVDERALHLCG